MALEKSGFGFAHDVRKAGHEESAFPILCETCLGDNPYVRMMRDRIGKECNICSRPYTAFRWKAGTKGRYKQSVLCQQCAKLKNVCQCCIFDLEYGLPVQVRDKFLQDAAKLELPESRVNREYFVAKLGDDAEEAQRKQREDEGSEALRRLARSAPYYRRNLARECSFFAKGECTRGSQCPFRHYSLHSDPALANQSMKDRFTGSEDPVATKILRADATSSSSARIEPPEDRTISTLVVSNVQPSVSETDLRSRFFSFGELRSIKVVPRLRHAFVTFAQREAAEKATAELTSSFVLKDVKLRLEWQRKDAKKTEGDEKGGAEDGSTSANAAHLPPAPGERSVPFIGAPWAFNSGQAFVPPAYPQRIVLPPHPSATAGVGGAGIGLAGTSPGVGGGIPPTSSSPPPPSLPFQRLVAPSPQSDSRQPPPPPAATGPSTGGGVGGGAVLPLNVPPPPPPGMGTGTAGPTMGLIVGPQVAYRSMNRRDAEGR